MPVITKSQQTMPVIKQPVQIAKTELVVIVLAPNSSGGSSPGLPDARLTIRCVDEDGAMLYEQSVSAVHGRTETIIAPPLKGYLLAIGEPDSQTLRIVSGSNVVTFRYVADEVTLEDLRVPAGEGGRRPGVSGAVRELLETEELAISMVTLTALCGRRAILAVPKLRSSSGV